MKKLRKINRGYYQNSGSASTVVTSPADLVKALVGWWKAAPQYRVWLFRGDLGAGKTTAIRGLLRAAGVKRVVTSPTFALLRAYRLPGRFTAYHFDAYRIKSRVEWAGIGLLEALSDPRGLVLVEWPERLRGLRWGPHCEIKISITPTGRRVSWRRVG